MNSLENLTKGPGANRFKTLNVTELQVILIWKVGSQVKNIYLLFGNAANFSEGRRNRHVRSLTAGRSVVTLAVVLIGPPEMFQEGDDLIVTPLICPMKAGLLLKVLVRSGVGDLGAPGQEVDVSSPL